MRLESEICRKIYDHHSVLKGDINSNLVSMLTQANLSRENITEIVNTVNGIVDNSSGKMATDYQKLFAANK
jgi:hypothetical protein